jgi:hypothetical protein
MRRNPDLEEIELFMLLYLGSGFVWMLMRIMFGLLG